MKAYILESNNKFNSNKNEYYLLNGLIPLYIINKINSNININNVIDHLESNLSKEFLSLVEVIYVGDFKELEERSIDAMYKDNAIYLSTFKDDNYASDELIARNICHELAHALEEKYYHEIHDDDLLRKEYNAKKQKLFSILKDEDLYIDQNTLFDPDEAEKLDKELLNKVGYDRLSLMIPNLFITPYSVTTIREYFADGLEEYFFGDPDLVKSVCPVLYSKIKDIT